jgi:hypothetical protein
MSKHDKLLKRFLNRPKDFTYNELKTLLNGLGYIEFNKGATSGSRVSFLHSISKHIICLHKPHPSNIIKSYQVDLIIDELKSKGAIK